MNRRELLEVALNSLAGQTRPCTEAIVIDAGDDGSDGLCQRYPFVRYFRQTTRGLTPARNEALRYVQTDYVGMLDSDDFYEPRFLEVCAGLLDQGADVAYSRGYRVSSHGRQAILVNHRQPEAFLRSLVEDNFLIASFTLQRAECFRKVAGYREGLALADDYDLYLKFCLAGFRFAHAPEALSNRLHHEGSLTLSDAAANIRAVAAILQFHQAEICRVLNWPPGRLLAKTHLRLARHYFDRGELAEARRELKSSLKLNPRQLTAWLYWITCMTAPISTGAFRMAQKLKRKMTSWMSRQGLLEERW